MPTKKQKGWMAKDEKWAEDYFIWWLDRLGAHPMKVDIYFKREDEDNKNAEVRTDHPYRHCHLTIFPRFWDFSKERQKQILTHEAVHVIMTPMVVNRMMASAVFTDYEENLTDQLSIVLYQMSEEMKK